MDDRPVGQSVEVECEGLADGSDTDWGYPVKFLWLVGYLDRGILRELKRRLPAHDLSPPEYSTMSVLHWTPGLSNAELARRAMVTPQSMNEVITRLVERGLVERSHHPDNGRILMTRITEEGDAVLKSAMDSIAEFEADLLEGIPESAMEDVREHLTTILGRMRQF